MPDIIRSPRARKDASEIWHFIALDNPSAADHLIKQFEEALATIARFPGVGSDRGDLRRGMRSFIVGQYVIFFRRRRDGIEVVRIIHGARDFLRVFKKRRRS